MRQVIVEHADALCEQVDRLDSSVLEQLSEVVVPHIDVCLLLQQKSIPSARFLAHFETTGLAPANADCLSSGPGGWRSFA